MRIQAPSKQKISIRILLTPNQYERFVNKCYSKGYVNIGPFVRDVILKKDMVFEAQFNDMYKILKRLERKVENIEEYVSKSQEGLLI